MLCNCEHIRNVKLRPQIHQACDGLTTDLRPETNSLAHHYLQRSYRAVRPVRLLVHLIAYAVSKHRKFYRIKMSTYFCRYKAVITSHLARNEARQTRHDARAISTSETLIIICERIWCNCKQTINVDSGSDLCEWSHIFHRSWSHLVAAFGLWCTGGITAVK